eukprot:489574_1
MDEQCFHSYTAALYAARAKLKPLVLAGIQEGGQLMLTSDIENFPGRDKTGGAELMADMRRQAERFGAEVWMRDVKRVKCPDTPGEMFGIEMKKAGKIVQVEARSVIIATGAQARWLGVEGENALRGAGVSTCATCDGAFYEGKKVMVVGGGDNAMEEALFLTRFANSILLIHRRDGWRASKIMQERVAKHEKIEIRTNRTVRRWLIDGGNIGKEVKFIGAELEDPTKLGFREKEAFDGAFLAIGHDPVTAFLEDTGVEIDGEGYLIQKHHSMTSIPGMFAAGDVSDKRYRQAITAASAGCMAAMDAQRWLEALQ